MAESAASFKNSKRCCYPVFGGSDFNFDFDLAEDALHDAFRAALEQWQKNGVPSNPRAWLVSTSRFNAIDRIRRRLRFDSIQVEHAEQIAELYSLLMRVNPSPVVELNRAVAVAMHDGPLAGLKLIDGILTRGELAGYHLVHSAQAELCRRLGRTAEARAGWERALALAQQEPERRFLEQRLAQLPNDYKV